MNRSALSRMCAYYEALSPDNLSGLLDCYAPDAHFVDPFNDVRGRAAIEAVMRDMFEHLASPRFTVLQTVSEGTTAFVVWRFEFRMNGRPCAFEGASRLKFDERGLIAEHQDFWDPARGLYEYFPLFGRVFAWLRRRCASIAR